MLPAIIELDTRQAENPGATTAHQSGWFRRLRNWLVLAALAVGLLFWRTHYRFAVVLGDSMLPVLRTGDVLLVDKTGYRSSDPSRRGPAWLSLALSIRSQDLWDLSWCCFSEPRGWILCKNSALAIGENLENIGNMKSTTRRSFLKLSLTAGMTVAMPRLVRSAGPSDAIGVGIIGLGGLKIPGSVGGRGRQLIASLRKLPEAKIVALCDVDESVLEEGVQSFKNRGETVRAYGDLRKLLDDKAVDVVTVALPNHWHALATIWACQAGKDVYVEKPFSYNLWEGRQAVAAARKYQRVVQTGMQNHSSPVLREAFDYLHRGELGAIQSAHAVVYRPREGIAMVSAPTPPPATVNYDLWCGPASAQPLMRPHLHYEWHWFWNTGNGEIGNNGVHDIDLCRWALRQNQLPPRAISIGGRFAVHDRAETANTQIALLDYKPAPILCEVRNVRSSSSKQGIGKYRTADHGIVIDCEGGYLAGDSAGVTMFDKQGQPGKQFRPEPKEDLTAVHLANFLGAVRSRNSSELAAEALTGHLSAGCCHLGNVSHRLGRETRPNSIRDAAKEDVALAEAFERCQEYLRDNGVDLGATPAVLGSRLTLDPGKEEFVGHFATEATRLSRRQYRKGFEVPRLA